MSESTIGRLVHENIKYTTYIIGQVMFNSTRENRVIRWNCLLNKNTFTIVLAQTSSSSDLQTKVNYAWGASLRGSSTSIPTIPRLSSGILESWPKGIKDPCSTYEIVFESLSSAYSKLTAILSNRYVLLHFLLVELFPVFLLPDQL